MFINSACICVESLQSCLTLCDHMVIACQAPLSMGFSRQEYWSGMPFPSPGDLPNLGIEHIFLTFPALADRFFTTSATKKTYNFHNMTSVTLGSYDLP